MSTCWERTGLKIDPKGQKSLSFDFRICVLLLPLFLFPSKIKYSRAKFNNALVGSLDRRKALEEREKFMDQIEAERLRLDEIRIQQNQRELEIHQRMKMVEDAQASLGAQSYQSTGTPPCFPGFLTKSPIAASETHPRRSSESMNVNCNSNADNGDDDRNDTPGGILSSSSSSELPSVSVYRSGVSDRTLLGKVC